MGLAAPQRLCPAHRLSAYEMRSAAVDADVLAGWQEVVDAMVVAGVTRLAPYSE